MQYFKRNWDETRGGAEAAWGTSTWYFETGTDMWPTRQIEIYANGTVLQYDEAQIEDEYGGLAEAALDAEEFAPFEITREEFEHIWLSREPTNKKRGITGKA